MITQAEISQAIEKEEIFIACCGCTKTAFKVDVCFKAAVRIMTAAVRCAFCNVLTYEPHAIPAGRMPQDKPDASDLQRRKSWRK